MFSFVKRKQTRDDDDDDEGCFVKKSFETGREKERERERRKRESDTVKGENHLIQRDL